MIFSNLECQIQLLDPFHRCRLGLKDATLFALISRHVMETSKVRSWSGSVLSSISWAMSNSRCDPSVPLYLLSMVSDNRPPFVDDVSAMSACKLLCGIARLRTRVYRKQALVDTLAGKIKSYLLIASTSSLRPYLKSSQIVDILYSLATLRHCDITLWDLLCSILTLPISSTQERLINSLDIHGLIIMLWSTSVIGADLLSPIGLPVRRLMNSLESLDLKESILLLWSLSRQPLVLSRIRSMRNIFYCLVIGVLENILTLLDGQGLTIKSTISLHESLYVLGSLKVPHELRLKIGKLSSQSCNRMRATSNQDPTLSQVLITLRSMRIVSREFHIRSFSYPSLRTTRRFIHVEAPCGLDIVLMLVHNYEFSANVHGSRTKRRRELLGSTFIELQASQSYLGKHKRLIIFNSDDFKKLKLRYQRQQYLNMILKL